MRRLAHDADHIPAPRSSIGAGLRKGGRRPLARQGAATSRSLPVTGWCASIPAGTVRENRRGVAVVEFNHRDRHRPRRPQGRRFGERGGGLDLRQVERPPPAVPISGDQGSQSRERAEAGGIRIADREGRRADEGALIVPDRDFRACKRAQHEAVGPEPFHRRAPARPAHRQADQTRIGPFQHIAPRGPSAPSSRR